MKIRNKILISSFISIILIIILGYIVYTTSQEINKSVARRTLAQNIITDVFDINSLRAEYVLNPGERPKIQWFSKYESLGNNIKKVEEEEWGRNLKNIDQSYNNLKPLFSNFVDYTENPGGKSPELGIRLRGQMLIKSQEIVSISQRLSSIAAESVLSATKKMVYIIIAVIVTGIMIIINSILIFRLIVNPIHQLHKATEELEKGNFNARVDIKTHDELEQLGKSFNKTAEALGKSQEFEQIARLFSESIIDSISSNIIVTDNIGVVIALNSAAERMWGIKRKDALGKNFIDLKLEGTAAGLKKDMETVIQTKKTFRVRSLPYINQAGGKFFIDISYVPLLDAQGNMQGVVSVGDDITEMKGLQENLQRLEKLAVIGKLAGIMGHEIRNPLGVIRNSIYFINLKLKESLDEKIKKHMNILETEINTADKIISDVLEFARIKFPVMAETDINSAVEESLSKADIPNTVKVQTNLGENLPKVKADVLQIKQVFSNIISNAIEAMPKGGELKVTTKQTDNSIFAAFKDTGVGISKENLNKVFEPLFSTKAKGVGLGLTACQTIIEGHRGKIEVESEEGKGATFTVKLPLA